MNAGQRVASLVRRAIVAGAFGLAMIGALANADPIPLGATPADDALIVNFDFTGSIPPPPYADVLVILDFGPDLLDSGDWLAFDFYPELNGQGPRVALDPVITGPKTSYSFKFVGGSDFLDGQFSFGLRMKLGTADYLSSTATGTDDAGAETVISGRIAAIPEPASLALLGLSLAGLAATRKRKHQ